MSPGKVFTVVDRQSVPVRGRRRQPLTDAVLDTIRTDMAVRVELNGRSLQRIANGAITTVKRNHPDWVVRQRMDMDGAHGYIWVEQRK